MRLKKLQSMWVLMLSVLAGAAIAEGGSAEPSAARYRDASLPTDERVKDLLSRMTVDEKLAQLGKLRAFNAYDRIGGRIVPKREAAEGIATNCPGTAYGVLRADWWTGRNWNTGVAPEMAVEAINAFQRIAIERTRLGIPIFFVEEAPHGLMALGEPVYPTGLGLGSTFDAPLMRRIGRQIGGARARGVHCAYAPILDIARDPRWSRCEECFGEDPELVSVLGCAEYEGLREAGMEPCLKHYVGGGSSEGGHNTASAHFGPYELFNVQLRPFRRCIDAGARHLMCTYHDVDGEPCTGSRFLLTDVLRGQLGFDGFVTADGGAIQLLKYRGIAATMPQAAAMAVKAGCDGESGSATAAQCGSVVREAYEASLLTKEDLDRAVGRLLALKFDMGLFEHPYATSHDSESGRALALEAARKSLVLLENRDVLPLAKGLSVAVIGPNADDKIMNQLGDYTAPQRRGDVVTVLDGVKAFASRVAYAKGCGIRSKNTDGFSEAERLASEADVTVLVLGGSSSPYAGVTQSDALGGATVVTGKEDDENDKDSGEGTDRSTLGYSGVQEDLFRAVRAKAKKLIVVLIQGRPLVVDEIAAKADAVLLAWYPGSMGGQAVAEALYGEVNPSGRLPISIPYSVGQLPVCSGGYAANRPRYIDGSGDAAYPFGYGLSYTTFAYSDFAVSKEDNNAEVSVSNTGSRDGDEIVRLYFSVKGSGRQRPHRELLAFKRVSLRAGETRRVTLPFDHRLFGGYGRDGVYEPPRGEVALWVDGCENRATWLLDRQEPILAAVGNASLSAAPKWISGGTDAPEKPAPVLVREFALDATPTNAVFTVAVAGWCEVSVNGKKVGRDVLSPVTCQPDRRTSSLDFDVTGLLKPGTNTLEVLLGNGWQNTFTVDAWSFHEAPWRSAPKIRGELVCDGKTAFTTDGTWFAYDSPIVFNGLRNGEWYDARLEGIRANMRPAKVEKYAPWGAVSTEDAVPCREFETFEPKCVLKSPQGLDIYDFGANIAGWCEIEVEGAAGAKVAIDYDESLADDGSLLGHIKQHTAGRGEKRPVQHDEYTLAGRPGGERWHPRFTYHGFRYAQVSLSGGARLKSIRSRFVHSSFGRAGTVETSDATFSALQSATERSYLSNFVGIPTDCPHREKNGWTGDAQLAMETGLWNYDAKAGYMHFLRMVLDAQRPNGAIPCILPCSPKFGFFWGSGPAWDAILFEIPWQLYRFYGDDAPAHEAYGAMKRYIAFIEGNADGDGLYDYGLGDWCAPKEMKKSSTRFTDSAYVYEFNRRMAFWAERFGEGEYAAERNAAAAKVREAFNRAFYRGDGLYEDGQLASLAAPLYFKGLCVDGEEEKVASRLVETVRAKGHRAYFGILGAKWVPRVLADYGHADDAFRLFVQPEAPGWAQWLELGGGTLLEHWNGTSSHNHIMFGDLSAWVYEYAAGIVPVEPGFKKIAFRPHVLDGVGSFVATHKTPFGEIRAGWKRSGGKVEFICETPEGVEVVSCPRMQEHVRSRAARDGATDLL